MKKRILLPTDFSENAMNAIDYSIELFKNEQCDFYILNTYTIDEFTMELTITKNLKELEEQSKKGLYKILERVSVTDENINHNFFIVSRRDNLLTAMKDIVAKRDIEMVVMGTKGRTDSRNKIYGSNTVLAMEKIRNCPVLAIPHRAIYKEIKEIAFPTNYRTHFKRREFQYLADIAKMTDAAIRILHVSDQNQLLDEDQKNNKKLLEEYFIGLKYSFHILHNNNVQDGLSIFIQNEDIDMISFINKKHSFFESILSKPMVKKLGYHSKIPVLTLHDFRN
ncbi:universal stress protein [uncultured Aquimarina sp.]|uniref:universal stress protein n=1 Tax=uncultured Aquimarina sp. TaxID=575652 RepID=UPI0026145D3C|nr:universal stress protein [uncultured Aquimarina sp.]